MLHPLDQRPRDEHPEHDDEGQLDEDRDDTGNGRRINPCRRRPEDHLLQARKNSGEGHAQTQQQERREPGLDLQGAGDNEKFAQEDPAGGHSQNKEHRQHDAPSQEGAEFQQATDALDFPAADTLYRLSDGEKYSGLGQTMADHVQ